MNQNKAYITYNEEIEDKTSTKDALKPWLNPIKDSVDKMLGKK